MIESLVSMETVENDDDKESLEVRDRFSTFLHDYINRNALKHGLLTKMKDILVSLVDLDITLFFSIHHNNSSDRNWI